MTAYLDCNATTPVRPQAAEAMLQALSLSGNASSVHASGRAARRVLEQSRQAVAGLVKADPAAVVFTSGGSEANALALAGFGRKRIVASAIEHPSVLKAADCALLPVDGQGLVNPQNLERLLASEGGRDVLVAVMLANNETGVIQPVAELARIAHAHGALIHCDAVQAAGKIAIDMAALGVDSLALSAHKLGGPQGVGALILAAGREVAPLIKGGAQENRRRAGTENLPGIAGFAAAVQALGDDAARLTALRDRLEREARALKPDLVVFGEGAARLPNTCCLGLPGLSSQTVVMALDLAGVMVSAGSACSSGKVGPSPVLTAMGAGDLAAQAIRISLGWASTDPHIDEFLDAFAALLQRQAAA